MQAILGLAVIIAIGWLIIQILPTILPFVGYAIVGMLAITLIANISK